MLVYIVTAVFPPEPVMTASTSSDLAEELVNRGHRVIVFTPFPNRPSGVVYEGYKIGLEKIENRKGYEVVHSWHTLSKSSRVLSRTAENASFGISSTVSMAKRALPDIVYMNTWPFIAQAMNGYYLTVRGVPLICSIQDVYPESLLGKGMLREGGLVPSAMKTMDGILLRRCDAVTTISEGMREFLIEHRKLERNKVLTVPNWQSADKFKEELPRNGAFRAKWNLPPDRFVAMFAGSLTMSAGVELYIETAKRLTENENITIVLVGDGSRREWLEEQVRENGLKNILVIYPLLPDDVPEVQAAADVLMLSLAGTTSQNAAPSKQVAYMLSGRPVIGSVSADSPPADVIERSQGGFVVQPDDPDALAARLVECSRNREILDEMGRKAKAYAKMHFSREATLPKLVRLLESVEQGSF